LRSFGCVAWERARGIDRACRVAGSQYGDKAGPPRTGRPSHLACWRAPDAVDDRSDREPAPELDCLRTVLAPGVLDAAARRADLLDIGAGRVLIQSGIIDEQANLDIERDDLVSWDRRDTPLADHQMPFAAASGLMPIRHNGELAWAIAPRRLAARILSGFAIDDPRLRLRLRLATEPSMQQFLQHATSALQCRHPALSAAAAAETFGRCPFCAARRVPRCSPVDRDSPGRTDGNAVLNPRIRV
jgi:hypothetical protein